MFPVYVCRLSSFPSMQHIYGIMLTVEARDRVLYLLSLQYVEPNHASKQYRIHVPFPKCLFLWIMTLCGNPNPLATQ